MTHCGQGPACGAPMGGCNCRCECACGTCRPSARRGTLKKILADPARRRTLFARCIQSMQNMEGIDTTLAQAYAAYDQVQTERPQAVVNVY